LNVCHGFIPTMPCKSMNPWQKPLGRVILAG
jgi:hypothetical protein